MEKFAPIRSSSNMTETPSAAIGPQQQLLSRKVGPSSDRSNSSFVSFGLRHLVFCASAVVLMFSNDDSNAVAFQVLGVALFVLSGLMFFVSASNRPVEITPFDT